MTRELNRLMLSVTGGFLVVTLAAVYWSVFQGADILTRDDNPRQVFAEQALKRGSIVDRDGVVLASGSQSERRYPHEGVEGAIGYYDYQFGSVGVEAAYNDILTGEIAEADALDTFVDDLLHRSDSGYDLRTTIDLDVQQTIHDSLGEHSGAAVMVHVPSGDVWAMVSHPSYDPNQVALYLETDDNGDPVTEIEPGSPLYNRVRQGGYQPGGVMQIPLLIGLLNSDLRLDTTIEQAGLPVELPQFDLYDSQIGCLSEPANTESMTLQDAFALTCPRPFVNALENVVSVDTYQQLLERLGLLSAPSLDRVVTGVNETSTLNAIEGDLEEQLVLAAVGQGRLTVNPLQMARLIAAIANQGNAPALHLADAYRDAQGDWQPLQMSRRQPAILLPEVALNMRQAMRRAAQTSPLVMTADRTDLIIRGYDMYGHVATAHAGEHLLSWFNGFIDLGNGESVVVVVVVEDALTPEAAAQVAGDAFQAAALALDPPPIDSSE